jgi:GMC oxidoreductase
VLDLSCRIHDVDNLYIVDGSFFPSNSGVNPILTIMANALRVGDRANSTNKMKREPLQESLVTLILPLENDKPFNTAGSQMTGSDTRSLAKIACTVFSSV